MSNPTLEIQVPPDRTVTFRVPDEVQARQVKITIEPVELEEAGVTLTPRQKALHREMDHFVKMHPHLVSRYPGQYVAILDGRVVDADQDRVRIWSRVEAQYANQPVFITRVRSESLPPLHFVSTRLNELVLLLDGPNTTLELIEGR